MSDRHNLLGVPDPVLLRGLAGRRLGRRQLLRLAGVGALGAASLLPACGVAGQGGGGSRDVAQSEAARFWAGKKRTGEVDWANWPLYLDVSADNEGVHPSLELFTKETGIRVNYSEVIQSVAPFFAKVQPPLSADEYCGYDVACVTNGTVYDKMRELGYLIPLDHSKLPNFFAHAGNAYQNRSYDPQNSWTVPWQSGFTGLAYNPDKVDREITDFADLLDPKFAGKVGMFADNEELPNSALLALGVEPQKSTEADWHKAADWLLKVKPNVRQYYNQDYIEALAKGDIWVSQAWSGDIFQQNLSGTDLKFVFPKSGSLLWTDNFVLLKNAKHPVDAMELMDFYYKPEIAAMVSEYVNYVSPVPGAKDILLAKAAKTTGEDGALLKEVASSEMVFPSEQTYANARPYRTLTMKELQTWNSIFEPVYQS